MAVVTCADCNLTYDDTYRLTFCPHEQFRMKTHVFHSRYGFLGVATSVEQLREMEVEADRRAREERPKPGKVDGRRSGPGAEG